MRQRRARHQHGQRRVHAADGLDGFQHHAGQPDLGQETEQAQQNGKYGGRAQVLQHLLHAARFARHQYDALRPQEQVEHRDVHGDVKHAFLAVQALRQWNADEAAVGIDHGDPLDIGRRIALRRDQHITDQDFYSETDGAQHQRYAQIAHHLRPEIDLIGGEHQQRTHQHQRQAGQLSVGRLVDQPHLRAEHSDQQHDEHDDNLILNDGGHIHAHSPSIA